MKRVVLAFIFISSSFFLRAQHAFYEAQYLSNIPSSYLKQVLNEANEIPLTDVETRMVQNYVFFLDNRFNPALDKLEIHILKSALRKYETRLLIKNSGKDSSMIKNTLGSSGIMSAFSLATGGAGRLALSPLQQTNIIDGLTQFYAEEFRKAQMITFMQLFEKTLGKTGELQVLFPGTYTKLLNTDATRFPDLGTEYKAVFNEDLAKIADRMIEHIDKHTALKNPALDSKLQWLHANNVATIRSNAFYTAFKLGRDIGSKLTHNFHPVELLYYLDNTYYNDKLVTQAKTVSDSVVLALHGLNLLQQNLLDSAAAKAGTMWISLHQLRLLQSKRDWLNFTGLLYQQDKDFFEKYIFKTNGMLDKLREDSLVNYMRTKTNAVVTTLDEWQALRLSLTDAGVNDHFSAYLKFALKLIECGNTLLSAPIHDVRFKKYVRITDCALNIYDNTRKKDYSNHVYYILQATNEIFGVNDHYFAVLNALERYGAFMSDIVHAKNPEEVKNCIRKYAAPPTSFILKREYKSTFSVTGQPGYFVSMEKMDGSTQTFGFVSGITLPIGFEWTMKTKSGLKTAPSVGLFAQVIDLGAVLNFRLSDSVSTLPDKIELSQVFSPGASITYGLKNSPITFGLGYQYTPQLRKVTSVGGIEFFPNGHRVFFRLAWDIPMLNIGRSKKK